MRPIPKKLRDEMAKDEWMKRCARDSRECSGRIEFHHAIQYQGRQLNERFAIIPLCKFHHTEGGMNDELARLIAYERATDEELDRYKTKWRQERDYLREKYKKPINKGF